MLRTPICSSGSLFSAKWRDLDLLDLPDGSLFCSDLFDFSSSWEWFDFSFFSFSVLSLDLEDLSFLVLRDFFSSGAASKGSASSRRDFDPPLSELFLPSINNALQLHACQHANYEVR